MEMDFGRGFTEMVEKFSPVIDQWLKKHELENSTACLIGETSDETLQRVYAQVGKQTLLASLRDDLNRTYDKRR